MESNTSAQGLQGQSPGMAQNPKDHPEIRGESKMNREILNDVAMDGSIMSPTGTAVDARNKRVRDRLGIDAVATATSAAPEESLVVDDRCDLSPAQMVETKLTRVLGGSTLPVSHLQMRGILRKR